DAREEAEQEERSAQAMMIADPAEADRWLRYTKDADTLLSRALKEFFALKDREAAEAEENACAEADESPPDEADREVGVPGEEPVSAASAIPGNEPGAPVGDTYISGVSKTYVASSGIPSDPDAGLDDPAHAAWLAALSDPGPGRPPQG